MFGFGLVLFGLVLITKCFEHGVELWAERELGIGAVGKSLRREVMDGFASARKRRGKDSQGSRCIFE